MDKMSEFNILIIFQVYGDRVSNYAIHSHAIFGCDNINREKVSYGMWVVLNFKVVEKI